MTFHVADFERVEKERAKAIKLGVDLGQDIPVRGKRTGQAV